MIGVVTATSALGSAFLGAGALEKSGGGAGAGARSCCCGAGSNQSNGPRCRRLWNGKRSSKSWAPAGAGASANNVSPTTASTANRVVAVTNRRSRPRAIRDSPDIVTPPQAHADGTPSFLPYHTYHTEGVGLKI